MEPLTQSDDLAGPYQDYRQSASADAAIARARARLRARETAPAAPAEAAPAADDAAKAPEDKPPIAARAGATAVAIGRDVGKGLVEAPRQAVGGVSDAIHNTFMALSGLGDWLNENVIDARIAIPPTGIEAFDKLMADPLKAAAGEKNEVAPAQSVTGGLIRETARFLTGFVPLFRAGKALGAGNIVSSTAAGGAGDALTRDPSEDNLSNLVQKFPTLRNPVTEFLSADPDDSEALARFKKGVEGAGLGLLADGFVAAVRAISATRKAGTNVQGGADALAAERAKYGELGDRDFMILGDPEQPLVRVARPGEDLAEQAARQREKMATAEEATKAAPTAPELVARVRELLNFRPRNLEDLGKEDLAQAMAEGRNLIPLLDALRKGAKPEGESLVEFVRKAGGIRDDGGELRYIFGDHKARPGVINQNGRKLDDIAGDAWEAGYLPEFNERPTVDDFLDTLRGDYDGTAPRFGKSMDENAQDAFRAQQQLGQALDELGIDLNAQSNAEILTRLRSIADDAPARDLAALEKEGADMSAAGLTRAGDVGESGVYVNFGRIQGADDVKALLGEMTRVFRKDIDEARRGVQSNAETQRLADELGMSIGDLLNRRQGQPFNAEEAVAARRLWAASTEKLLELADKAASPLASSVDHFNFRRMMSIHYAVQAEVIGARTETARALQAWSIPAGGGVERARAVQQMLDTMGGPQFSQAMARRLAILRQQQAPPDAINTMVRKTWAASTVDAVQEAWINALLSSPKTHIVNVTSNFFVAANQIAERAVAGKIAAATGGEIAPGEAVAMTYGFVTGLKDAFRLGAKALRTGETGSALGKVDLPREPAIHGDWLRESGWNGAAAAVDFIGQATRVPTRLLGAEDEFFKSIGYRMELHAQALRQASAAGLSGEALGRRIAEIVRNPPEHIRLSSADAALYSTFSNAPGRFGQSLLQFRNGTPAAAFVLPFIRTPVNIARYAFERSPLAPLVGQWRDDIAAGGARAELALARLGTGSVVMAIAADYADSGLISGGGPQDTAKREALTRQGWQPYSVKLGDKWVSYNRLDPLGMTMGFAADLAEIARAREISPEDLDEVNEILGAMIGAVSRTVISKTYMQGVADFVEMMDDPKRKAATYLDKFAGSFVPAGAAAVKNVIDPAARETMSIGDSIQARLAVLSERLPPRRDLWGAEIRPDSGMGTGFDAFSPIQLRNAKPSPIDAEMQRLNMGLERIAKKTSFAGVPVNLRDWPQVYDAYVRLAGNELQHPAWGMGAKDLLDAIVSGGHELSPAYELQADTAKPEEGGKAAFIARIVGEFRQMAQRQILDDPRFAAFAEEIGVRKEKLQEKRQPAGLAAPALQ